MADFTVHETKHWGKKAKVRKTYSYWPIQASDIEKAKALAIRKLFLCRMQDIGGGDFEPVHGLEKIPPMTTLVITGSCNSTKMQNLEVLATLKIRISSKARKERTEQPTAENSATGPYDDGGSA